MMSLIIHLNQQLALGSAGLKAVRSRGCYPV